MTQEIKTLTDKEIKQLVDAYVDYKKAEDRFKVLKEKLTSDLIEGAYVGKAGKIVKSIATQSSLDIKRLIEEHPELEALIDSYRRNSEFSRVTISNYK